MEEERPASRLDQISTHWPLLGDPAHVVMRYGRAVKKYLHALLPDPDEAEEAAQDFLLKVVEGAFRGADPERGSFRHYLKAAARNAALTRRRRRRGGLPVVEANLEELPAPPLRTEAEAAWLEEWRACLMDRAWRVIEDEQRSGAPGNLSHTVLRLAADHPELDSRELALRAGEAAGRPLAPEAFRKQLSRARRRFAEILSREAAATLIDPTPERVEAELAELGLADYLRPLRSRPASP